MGYPREVYQKAWQTLDSRREIAQRTAQQHQEEIKEKIPEIDDIQAKMTNTAARISRSVLTNPNQAQQLVEQLAEENLALQAKRKELLLAHGYPANYLAEQYHCGRCSDTGYVGTEMCTCLKALLQEEAFAQLSYVSDTTRSSFEDFSLDYYDDSSRGEPSAREKMADILSYCKAYARNFSIDAPSLLMMGQTGLGKTHLSLAIAWEVTVKGYGVVYTPVQKLMDKLEAQKFSYQQGDKENYAQNMQSVMECDLLVLDDLGTEFITTFTNSVLYNIINTRLVEGRPTIINTNLPYSEIESIYSQRMASRLTFGYRNLHFQGSDVRFLKRKLQHRKNTD